jgi:hypothetical protein
MGSWFHHRKTSSAFGHLRNTASVERRPRAKLGLRFGPACFWFYWTFVQCISVQGVAAKTTGKWPRIKGDCSLIHIFQVPHYGQGLCCIASFAGGVGTGKSATTPGFAGRGCFGQQ